MVWRWPWATEESQWRLHDNDWKIGKSREPWCIFKWLNFTRPVLLGPVFLRTALPCSGGSHLERGGMLLHDAVGIKSKKDVITKYRGAGVNYMGWGVYIEWLWVCYLTWQFGMANPPWLMKKIWYIIIFNEWVKQNACCLAHKSQIVGSCFHCCLLIVASMTVVHLFANVT